jgi:hypothetical protein
VNVGCARRALSSGRERHRTARSVGSNPLTQAMRSPHL